MKSTNYAFNNKHLQNIKGIFEEKSGIQLNKEKTGFVYRKPIAVALVTVLCLIFGTPVLAANVPTVYRLMYLVSPSVAQFFMPVQRSDESDGIKMEVVSAYIHGDTAEIYITLQDLLSDRIDDTTDLYDSYSINRPFDSAISCKRIGYDEESRTATFLIKITEWGSQDIKGDKITFSMREFLSHKISYKDIDIPVDLSLTKTANDTQQVFPNGSSGLGPKSMGDRMLTALIPAEPMQEFPVGGIDLTGIGYVDGKLHIQTSVADYLDNDNHGYFYLRDKEGNAINYANSFSFSDNYGQSDRRDWFEYVFDITKDEIGQYSLMGDFLTSGMHTEGYWSVTFPLEQAK